MGIDVGSSGCKVSIIDENGIVVYSASKEYSFIYTKFGNSELNAKLVIKAL